MLLEEENCQGKEGPRRAVSGDADVFLVFLCFFEDSESSLKGGLLGSQDKAF